VKLARGCSARSIPEPRAGEGRPLWIPSNCGELVERSGGSAFVREHDPPDVGGEEALETTHGFVASRALGALAAEVDAIAARSNADLGDHDEVYR